MAKQKLKIKKPSLISFSKLTVPFKDENNQKIFAGVLILISLYLIIAFISFFFEWKADDSLVSGKDLSDVITEKKINNSIGGLGAYIANLFIKLWFGVASSIVHSFVL